VLLGLACFRCHGGQSPADREEAPALVGPESVVVLRMETVESGPLIVGSLHAERQAVVRAELGGSVLEVLVQVGEPVRSGQELAKIEDYAVRDAYRSASAGVTAARQDVSVARRQVERAEELVRAGAIAERDLELARNNLSAARARLAQAQAQRATAREHLDAATVRAPFDGTISARAVNAGDVVSPGSDLFTVIDPSSMQLEASVPTAALEVLKVGTPVDFEVRGYQGRRFRGQIERIAPEADPATRQIGILVAIPNEAGELVAGLFAEGRVAVEQHQGLVVPLAAINRQTEPPTVLVVRDGRVARRSVQLGEIDEVGERAEIIAPDLKEGDLLLTGSGLQLPPGTRVKLAQAPDGGVPASEDGSMSPGIGGSGAPGGDGMPDASMPGGL
jgi:RND family efflux transporter MFP subunit